MKLKELGKGGGEGEGHAGLSAVQPPINQGQGGVCTAMACSDSSHLCATEGLLVTDCWVTGGCWSSQLHSSTQGSAATAGGTVRTERDSMQMGRGGG